MKLSCRGRPASSAREPREAGAAQLRYSSPRWAVKKGRLHTGLLRSSRWGQAIAPHRLRTVRCLRGSWAGWLVRVRGMRPPFGCRRTPLFTSSPVPRPRAAFASNTAVIPIGIHPDPVRPVYASQPTPRVRYNARCSMHAGSILSWKPWSEPERTLRRLVVGMPGHMQVLTGHCAVRYARRGLRDNGTLTHLLEEELFDEDDNRLCGDLCGGDWHGANERGRQHRV